MNNCPSCGFPVPPNSQICPKCGTPQPQGNKNRKALIAVLISLGAALAAIIVVIIIILNQGGSKTEPNTFDYTCSEYTDLMNRIMGGNKLEQSKWVPHSKGDGFTYTEKAFKIDLDTDKESQKVVKIAVSPDDSDDAVKIAAASIMTAEPTLTQKDALTQIAELKEKKRDKVENPSSVTTWESSKKVIIIEPRPKDDDKAVSTAAATTVMPAASTAAPTTKPTEQPATEQPTTIEPTTEEPTTEEPTTEEPTTAPAAAWKQAYIDYVNNADKFFTLFSLIDIDGDGVPELFNAPESSRTISGTRLCFMSGDTLTEKRLGASLYYAEGQGVLLTSTTMSGSQMVEVETFSDGKATPIHTGTRSMKDECKWDDKDVSLDEFNSLIKGYTDNMIQPKTVNKSEIISMIEAY